MEYQLTVEMESGDSICKLFSIPGVNCEGMEELVPIFYFFFIENAFEDNFLYCQNDSIFFCLKKEKSKLHPTHLYTFGFFAKKKCCCTNSIYKFLSLMNLETLNLKFPEKKHPIGVCSAY